MDNKQCSVRTLAFKRKKQKCVDTNITENVVVKHFIIFHSFLTFLITNKKKIQSKNVCRNVKESTCFWVASYVRLQIGHQDN